MKIQQNQSYKNKLVTFQSPQNHKHKQKMQSYSYEAQQQQQIQEYKQDLGLRKMLYKYQHQNEQLKNQIKALTQRLQTIMSTKGQQQQMPKQNNSPQKKMNQAHDKYLQQQMRHYLKRIQQINAQIKQYKQVIDQSKQQQYVRLTNSLKDKQNKLQVLRNKVDKFKIQFDLNVSSGPVQNVSTLAGMSNEELEIKYSNQLEQLRKRVRELQKTKYNNIKQDINRHMHMVNLQTKTRKINNEPLRQAQNSKQLSASPPKKGGLWGMDLTEENYQKIAEEFQQLKKQKNVLLDSIKVQNNGLRQKLAKLKNQYIDLSARSNINQSMTLSVPKKQFIPSTPKQNAKKTIVLPDIPAALGNSAYERKNDKNFVPKKLRLMQWNINKGKKSPLGFSWNDENNKSPITGINLWLDKYLIGIQFIHTLGETNQHYHCQGGDTKKLVPIQYRLNSNDYLQNIILVISKNNPKSEIAQNLIVGLELISKNGRKDTFGFKVGTANTQKFDFEIRNPQKPVYSYGSFTINSSTHLSSINSLGFAII